MSKKTYIIIAVIVVVVVIFILVSGNKNSENLNTVKTSTVSIAAFDNSGISGTATITEVEGKSKVVVSLNGYPVDANEPARINTGSCASLGGEKYPLTNVVSGASETVLEVSFDDLMKQLPLAINIHKSETELDKNVACGDIVAPTPVVDDSQTTPPAENENSDGTAPVTE